MALLTNDTDIDEEIAHIKSVCDEIDRYLLRSGAISNVRDLEVYERMEKIAFRRITDDQAVGGETLATRYQLEPLNLPNSQTFEHIRHPNLYYELTLLRTLCNVTAQQKASAISSDAVRKDARKQVLRSFDNKEAFDPDDEVEHLFAIARPAKWADIRILCSGRTLRQEDNKLLLKANRFLGHAAHGNWRECNPETFPIELADDTELINSAFELWDASRYDSVAFPPVYSHFGDALNAVRRLAQ